MKKFKFLGVTYDSYSEARDALNDALNDLEPGQNFGPGTFDIEEISEE